MKRLLFFPILIRKIYYNYNQTKQRIIILNLNKHILTKILELYSSAYRNKCRTFLRDLQEYIYFRNIKLMYSSKILEKLSQLTIIWHKNLIHQIIFNILKYYESCSSIIFTLLTKHFNQIIPTYYNKSLPLFVLTNYDQKIITLNSIENNNNPLSFMTKSLYLFQKIIPFSYTKKKFSHLLFFINPLDALKYKNFLQKRYDIKSITSFKIIPIQFKHYLLIKQKYSTNITIKLVPDLKEISYLLFSLPKNYLFFFDCIQKKNIIRFKGQPVYFISPFNNLLKINYYLKFKHFPVFTNFSSLQKFLEKVSSQQLISPIHKNKISIFIQNLENLLTTTLTYNIFKLIIIPSKPAWSYYKIYHNFNHLKYLSQKSFLGIFTKSFFILKKNIWACLEFHYQSQFYKLYRFKK
uniref:Uncharacterized protein n=1 Tax=Pterocladiophila hemisphaerica TaxID=2712948 RepID=A0A6M3WW66_9FLOR|nr:hypothetical protein [Pterocladiophila hemisphaerica]